MTHKFPLQVVRFLRDRLAAAASAAGEPGQQQQGPGPGLYELPTAFNASGQPSRISPATPQDDIAQLARLLKLSTPDPDPSDFADRIVARFGGYARVLAATPRELIEVPGLGEHGAAAIKLMQEAALRLLRDSVANAPVLDRWDHVIAYLTGVLAWERVEQFRILFLDEAGHLLADEAQARGTVNHTPVYPREVARRGLELKADGLILVHNHPSGDPTPSAPDIDMTGQVRTAVELFNMRIVDHVIIGNGRWTSFRAEGLLD
jgi:DNA repair protein RadC